MMIQLDSQKTMIKISQEARFTEWLQEHRGIVLKVARAFTTTKEDLDDLVQEILVQIWVGMPSFKAQAKPSTWIYRIALNKALTWQKKERRQRDRYLSMTDSLDLAVPESENRELLDKLYRGIRNLKPVDRSLMILHLDGFKYREMAEILGMTETNVGVRLNRAKDQLTEAMNKDI